MKLKFKTHDVNNEHSSMLPNNSGLVKHLYICVDLIYIKMYKKNRLWEFREISIVGTQRVSQESDTAERTAIEISELFHVMAFLQKGTSSRHFQIASLLNMKLCSDFII